MAIKDLEGFVVDPADISREAVTRLASCKLDEPLRPKLQVDLERSN